MAEEFERLLKASLAPQEREEDRQFIMRVHTAIRLDEELRAQRAAILRSLGVKLIALAAVVGALVWIGRAPAVMDFTTFSPSMTLAILILCFGALLALLSSESETPVISGA
jgi:hypothetical protein